MQSISLLILARLLAKISYSTSSKSQFQYRLRTNVQRGSLFLITKEFTFDSFSAKIGLRSSFYRMMKFDLAAVVCGTFVALGAFDVASAVVTEQAPKRGSYLRESGNDSKAGFKDEQVFWSRLLTDGMSMTQEPMPGDPCKDVECQPPDICDPTSSTCKPLQQTIPCVAVIDEWDSLFDPNPLWVTFRTNYTTRPFCLLTPLPSGGGDYRPL